jgi:hypothetical protein
VPSPPHPKKTFDQEQTERTEVSSSPLSVFAVCSRSSHSCSACFGRDSDYSGGSVARAGMILQTVKSAPIAQNGTIACFL